ncbi:MAG: hypothetical protein SFU99_05430 [Saprospiraceae bacterium]|nr:hypothetical protein [Saprospiraceae bacterium]
MKINFDTIATVVFSGLVGYFVEKFAVPGNDTLKGIILVVIFSIMALLIKETLIYLANINNFENKITGDWIEVNLSLGTSNEPMNFAIGKFIYDKFNKKLKYLGFAFDDKGILLGEFRSNYIEADEKNMSITYLFDGFMHQGKFMHETGLGFIRFSPVSKGKYLLASGNFRGVGSDFQPVYHQMKRIPTEIMKKIIGNKSINTIEEMQLVIKEYRENNQNFYKK